MLIEVRSSMGPRRSVGIYRLDSWIRFEVLHARDAGTQLRWFGRCVCTPREGHGHAGLRLEITPEARRMGARASAGRRRTGARACAAPAFGGVARIDGAARGRARSQ